jgi:hypothetical protein
MIKPMPLFAILFAAALAACGGGGVDADYDTGFATLKEKPSDEVLCSFIIGQTTMDDVTDALGAPTSYTEDSGGSFLQYLIGALGQGPVRGVFFSFDADGKLDAPSVNEVSFPQCWRDQLDAREAARNGL